MPLMADEIASDSAEMSVRNHVCKQGLTVEQALKKSIRRRSQRDLGWRVFHEEKVFDVERAFLVNKGIKIRYRWRVLGDNTILPVSKKAKSLCQ